MSIAVTAHGTLFKVGDGASPEVFASILGVSRVNAPDVRTEFIDVTSHDSSGGFREFFPGLKDGETVTAEMLWKPSDTVHKSLRVDAYAATSRNWQEIFPDATDNQVNFTGYISGFPGQANAAEVLRNTLSVKVTGVPTWE